MQTTANYGLKKPDGTDVVNVQDFNDNADTIDTELKKRVLSNSIGTKNSSDLPSTWAVGLYWSEVYNNGFPCAYGHCLTMKASRTSVTQLCIEWTGTDATSGKAWIRNKRDTGADVWSPWREFSFSGHTHSKSDITDFPSSMPANGGNSTTVNNHTANGTPSTTEKTDIIKMINEVFQSGTNVKSGAISAVNSKGGNLSASATWDQIIAAISAIAKGQGNAVESQVLSGVTFSNSDGQLRTGNMPNKGAVTITPGIADQVIPAGYHNGSGKVKGDANLIASNILKGKSIFNVAGSIDLSNLKPENVKKDVNINGTIGTLEERLDSSYIDNMDISVYKPINITSEGLWCQKIDGSSNNTVFLFDKLGNLVKSITCSNAYHFFQVSENYILVEYDPSNYTLGIFNHNGILIKNLNFAKALNTCIISEDRECLYLSDVTNSSRIYKYNFSDLSLVATSGYYYSGIQSTILTKKGLYVLLFSGSYFYISKYDDNNPTISPPNIGMTRSAYLSLFINSLN